jgi:hypothetical protein
MGLKQVHLSRLSPVMRPAGSIYPRQPQYLATPIPASMGNYEMVPLGSDVQSIDPRGMPLWSNLYRMGAAGNLSRVGTFGPAAFGDAEGSLAERARPMLPFLLALGVGAGLVWFMGR